MQCKYFEKQEDTIASQVFSVSAAMMGVCLTVISIINVVSAYKKIVTFADDLTAITAIVFLCACATSYFGLKTKEPGRRYLLEKIADGIFLLGLVMVAFVCIFIVITLGKLQGA